MIKKHCPNCGQTSYSACGEGKWICPTCATDLTGQPVLSLNSLSERISRLSNEKTGASSNKKRHLTLVYSK